MALVVVVEVLSICCGHGGTGETPFHIPPVATFNRDERNKESISRSTHGKMEHQSGTWKNQLKNIPARLNVSNCLMILLLGAV